MTNFGYARVSTATQDEVAQVDALRRAGVADDHLFIDHASGTRTDRPELPPVARPCPWTRRREARSQIPRTE